MGNGHYFRYLRLLLVIIGPAALSTISTMYTCYCYVIVTLSTNKLIKGHIDTLWLIALCYDAFAIAASHLLTPDPE